MVLLAPVAASVRRSFAASLRIRPTVMASTPRARRGRVLPLGGGDSSSCSPASLSSPSSLATTRPTCQPFSWLPNNWLVSNDSTKQVPSCAMGSPPQEPKATLASRRGNDRVPRIAGRLSNCCYEPAVSSSRFLQLLQLDILEPHVVPVVLQADVALAGKILHRLLEFVRRPSGRLPAWPSSQLIAATSRRSRYRDLGPFAANLDRIPLARPLRRVLRRRDEIVDRAEIVMSGSCSVMTWASKPGLHRVL